MSGRLMVGLRWWNEVSESGGSDWKFESLEEGQRAVNKKDSFVFWTLLYATPAAWCAGVGVGVPRVVLTAAGSQALAQGRRLVAFCAQLRWGLGFTGSCLAAGKRPAGAAQVAATCCRPSLPPMRHTHACPVPRRCVLGLVAILKLNIDYLLLVIIAVLLR